MRKVSETLNGVLEKSIEKRSLLTGKDLGTHLTLKLSKLRMFEQSNVGMDADQGFHTLQEAVESCTEEGKTNRGSNSTSLETVPMCVSMHCNIIVMLLDVAKYCNCNFHCLSSLRLLVSTY